jgi:uncharacterized protein
VNFLFAPGAVVPAADAAIEHAPVSPEQVVDGAPKVGFAVLGEATVAGGVVEVGIWEHTPGVSTDVETAEVFVVISGHARIDFVGVEPRSIQVGPGSVVCLGSGMRTVWTVTETLRKVYVT